MSKSAEEITEIGSKVVKVWSKYKSKILQQDSNSKITDYKYNKKVLLRERKRHTARAAHLSCSHVVEGVPLSWSGGGGVSL